jgi:hypothetical protein
MSGQIRRPKSKKRLKRSMLEREKSRTFEEIRKCSLRIKELEKEAHPHVLFIKSYLHYSVALWSGEKEDLRHWRSPYKRYKNQKLMSFREALARNISYKEK